MDKGIRELLDEEIRKEIEDFDRILPGDDNYSMATDRLTKLYKLRIEEKQADSETQLKEKQLSEGKKDRYLKLAVDAAGILLPIGLYHLWMRRGFKFEETGTYTSTTFRGLFSRFRPTK